MKTHAHLSIGAIFLSLALVSCEDKISPTLENAAPILAVDAWINNKPGKQVVVLSQTQGYFDATNPPGITGALVTIINNSGKVYSFVEDPLSVGNYVWMPAANEVFGPVGQSYTLAIQLNGESFRASSRMGRVPAIDSISFETEKRIGSLDSITRAAFWATDPVGSGDTYWIRSFKNGVPLSKPQEINIAYDGGFSAGGVADGVVFITPIRRRINAVDKDANGKQLSPIAIGDSINVQIHSVTLAAFDYLNQVSIQTNRPGGFQELFSTPLANVSTNVTNTNINGSKAIGFFNVSAVSTAGKRYKK